MGVNFTLGTLEKMMDTLRYHAALSERESLYP